MQRTIDAALIARRVAAVIGTVALIVMSARVVGPQLAVNFGRIADIALSESSGLLGLSLLCVTAAWLIILGRARRSKVRQASA